MGVDPFGPKGVREEKDAGHVLGERVPTGAPELPENLVGVPADLQNVLGGILDVQGDVAVVRRIQGGVIAIGNPHPGLEVLVALLQELDPLRGGAFGPELDVLERHITPHGDTAVQAFERLTHPIVDHLVHLHRPISGNDLLDLGRLYRILAIYEPIEVPVIKDQLQEPINRDHQHR